MILDLPTGANITVLNTIYHRSQKDPNTGKYKNDFLTIVYKDLDTGKKHHKIIYKPKYTFYKLKNGDPGYNLFFAHQEEVEPIECNYTDLEKTIAELTGNKEFYQRNRESGNYRANKQLHTLNSILGSDIDIEDYYRLVFDTQFINEPCSISKAYFDIEVDGLYARGDFPLLGECPINAVSLINESTNTVYVFLLENSKNRLIEEFKQSIDNDLFKELQEFIIENVGGLEKAQKYGVDKLNFQFNFYREDEEIRLIQDLFIHINTLSPDFLVAWNMAFDVPYIIERIKNLGEDPALIMSDPSYQEKYAEYYLDMVHGVEYEARGDFYNIASDTVYLDQLIHFASRRKNQSQFPDFKLDTAGSIIAGVHKLDYSDITTQVAKLPYLNYKTFVFYNIMDTIVQKCIESKVNDIDYIFNKCLMNNTRYAKGHRQTYYLTNRAIKEFRKSGYIFGNNINKYFGKKTEFEGALVNDPTHNSDYAKVKQHGEVLNVARNLVDYDYKSLYPSVARENNLAPNTLISKIFIDNKVHEKENANKNPFYDRGGSFMEDLMCGDYITFAHRWLHLADIKEMIEDLKKYLNENPVPNLYSLDHINHPVYMPIRFYDDKHIYSPITFHDEEEKGVNIIPKEIDFSYYLKLMEGK